MESNIKVLKKINLKRCYINSLLELTCTCECSCGNSNRANIALTGFSAYPKF